MAHEEKYTSDHPDFVYSSGNRILHWIRALVITGLIITGFYIADPFLTSEGSTDKLLYAAWTKWHLILGFILISSGILRIYLFFFGKDKVFCFFHYQVNRAFDFSHFLTPFPS